MTIFNSYVKLPEGIYTYIIIYIYTGKIGYHIPILFKSYAQVPDAAQCGSEDVRLLWSHVGRFAEKRGFHGDLLEISLGILAFYWPQNASNLLCFSWILNEIDLKFLDRKL